MPETYNEIFNAIYGDNRKVSDLNSVDRKSWRIIRALSGRKGFDAWWETIDDQIQNGIFDQIRNIVASGDR